MFFIVSWNYRHGAWYFRWIIILLLDWSGNYVLGTTEMSTYPHVKPSSNTRCGKVFSGSTGGIFYQPFIQVLENERCVWQIFVPGAKGYVVKFHYLGFNSENVSRKEQGVIISSYSRHRASFEYYINTTDSIEIPDCNLLIITFYTGVFETTAGSTGFAMEYETSFEGQNTPDVEKESKHYNIGSGSYFIKHPSGSDGENYYRRNELSTFVFLPRHNVVKNETKNTVIYTKNGLINSHCKDRLKIYFFNINSDENSAGWVYQGRVCANTEVEAFTSFEPIIIVFESDENYSKSYGFQFAYVAG